MKLKNKPTIRPEDLLTISQASEKLGKGFSYKSIQRRIAAGDWIEGIHFIDDAPSYSKLRSIKINLPAVLEWRSTPAAER
jgi:hypothetical protein